MGFKSGKALEQLFANAYLYVQPSEYEGLAVAVLDAMSFGTAALVSDIPENLEAMSGTGFSFKNKDVDDLAKELRELISNPAMVSDAALRAQEKIKTKFNWDSIALKTEEVYKSIR